MKQVTKARRWRPLVIVDIAVPRDAEPAIGELDGVYLFDIDDLERVVAANLAERAKAVSTAERIVGVEVAQFERWLKGQRVVPTIRALRDHFNRVGGPRGRSPAHPARSQGARSGRARRRDPPHRGSDPGQAACTIRRPPSRPTTPTRWPSPPARLFRLDTVDASEAEPSERSRGGAPAHRRALATLGLGDAALGPGLRSVSRSRPLLGSASGLGLGRLRPPASAR
jgi:hypothetical protein